MLSAETSALVAGGMRAPATAAAAAVTVRVLRPFMWGGERREVGGPDVAVEKWLAAELVTAGKAERVVEAPVPQPELTPETKPAAATKPAAKEKPRAH